MDKLTILLLLILVFGILYYADRQMSNKIRNFRDNIDNSDEAFSIKGINYTDIDDSYLGKFIGTLKAVTDNPYDPYAIEVYKGKTRIGYLPRDNKDLHQWIISQSKVTIAGYIDKGSDDGDTYYYGKVMILNKIANFQQMEITNI